MAISNRMYTIYALISAVATETTEARETCILSLETELSFTLII